MKRNIFISKVSLFPHLLTYARSLSHQLQSFFEHHSVLWKGLDDSSFCKSFIRNNFCCSQNLINQKRGNLRSESTKGKVKSCARALLLRKLSHPLKQKLLSSSYYFNKKCSLSHSMRCGSIKTLPILMPVILFTTSNTSETSKADRVIENSAENLFLLLIKLPPQVMLGNLSCCLPPPNIANSKAFDASIASRRVVYPLMMISLNYYSLMHGERWASTPLAKTLWGNNADLIWHVCNLQWLEPFDFGRERLCRAYRKV